jgi:hypothetical protein
MDGAELEKAKAIEIGSIVKAQNDSMRRSRALQALGRRVQAPTAESGKPSIRGKGQVATPTSRFSLLPFREDQEDLDTEMLDAFSDEWLFAHYVHHVIPLLLHFYAPRPVVIINFGFDISGVSQSPCSLQPGA